MAVIAILMSIYKTDFNPQTGVKYYDSFDYHDNNMLLLMNHLRNRRYTTACTIIRNNRGIINVPNKKGWTPFMVVLSNIKTLEDVKFIKFCTKYFNPTQINLNDMNYILIAIRHCAPKHLMLVFNILNNNKVKLEYETSDGVNALDMAIEMFHNTMSYDTDYYYMELIQKLRDEYKMKSNKYEIINYVEGNITAWIVDNLNCDSDSYQITMDNESLPGSIVAHVPNTDNVILEYVPQKPDPTDEARQKSLAELESMSGEDMKLALMKELDVSLPSPPLPTKKKSQMIPTADFGSFGGNHKKRKQNINIIKFRSVTTTNEIPKCYRCRASYVNENFGIFQPCNHSIMCMNCIVDEYEESGFHGCPLCGTIIESAIGKV